MQLDEGGQHADVEVVPLAQVVPDGALVEALALVQELGDVCGGNARLVMQRLWIGTRRCLGKGMTSLNYS